MDFGSELRTRRLEAGWTQEKLAAKAGVAVNTVIALETRKRGPRLSTATELADALGLEGTARSRLMSAARGDTTPPSDTDPAFEPVRIAAPRPSPRMLPYAVPDFVGRLSEIGQLIDLALGQRGKTAGTVVISTIDGMAGVGKTALAVHAAHRLAEHFPDGQLFVDLQGFTPGKDPLTPDVALLHLLRALEVREERIPAQLDDRANLWRHQVADRRLLVVLDNVASACQVRPLIPGTPHSAVLITSRTRITDLTGASCISLDVLLPDQAVELFVRTAGADRASEDLDAVERIVAICGYLPLAVRIVGARLAHRCTWTPTHLLGRLRDQYDLLAQLSIGDLDVAAAFTLSYQGLQARTQQMFRLLSLHPGNDFDLCAAAALVGDHPVPIQHLLDDLVDHHLLLEQRPGRYNFHDLLQAHARNLRDTEDPKSDQNSAMARLLDHYRCTASAAVGMIYPAEAELRPPVSEMSQATVGLETISQAQTWLDVERSNLAATATYSAGAGHNTHAMAISAILGRHLTATGHFAVGLAVHHAALQSARQLHDRKAEATIRTSVGVIHRRQGDYNQALEHYQQAATIAREIGDRAGEGRVLGNIGVIHERQSRYTEALHHHQSSLAIARELGNRIGEVITLSNIGVVGTLLGDHAQAIDHLSQSLAIATRIGDRAGQSNALGNIAIAYRHLGDHRQALVRHHEALAIDREINDRVAEANALNNIAITHRCRGDHQEALDHHRQSLAILRDIGDRDVESEALNSIGVTLCGMDRPREAIRHHQVALASAEDAGDRLQQAHAHAGLGDAHQALHQPDLARGRWFLAKAIYLDLHVPEHADMCARLAMAGGSPRPDGQGFRADAKPWP